MYPAKTICSCSAWRRPFRKDAYLVQNNREASRSICIGSSWVNAPLEGEPRPATSRAKKSRDARHECLVIRNMFRGTSIGCVYWRESSDCALLQICESHCTTRAGVRGALAWCTSRKSWQRYINNADRRLTALPLRRHACG